MTIKMRLLASFTILVTMVMLMSVVLVTLGYRNRKLSEQRMSHYSHLLFWREISQAFEIQRNNLNYYVILADEKEKNSFSDQHAIISERFSNVAPLSPEARQWQEDYAKLSARVEEHFRSASHDRFFQMYTGELSNSINQLRRRLRELVDHHARLLDRVEEDIRMLNKFGMLLSVAVGTFAIVIGGVMSVLIFRSISRPLSILQQGAQAIGEGNLEYQIPIASQDEIGRLAKSFNAMVANLRNLQLQIVQMDRMSSIGQLAGGVAHEINNPLTGVLGQAQLLLEKLPQEHPYRPSVERIESAAQRCRRIVRSLLDFSRDKNYNFVPTDISKLVDETLDFTKTELDSHNIRLAKNIPAGLPMLRASYGHLQQVFVNIINNAMHAMPKGGTLTIAVQKRGNFLELSVADTGVGIKSEHLNHVFDPFFTTKDVGKGTGLGLTISYGIIQRHQGEIIARSEGENKGAEFIVRLPIGQEGNV